MALFLGKEFLSSSWNQTLFLNFVVIITLTLYICGLTFKGKNAPATVSGKTARERLHNSWLKLQTDVNCYIDSDLDKISSAKFAGIRQVSLILIHCNCMYT